MGARFGLTVRLDGARDGPASADELSRTGHKEGGGHDDGEGGVLAPLDLDPRLGLGVDAGTIGKVANLEDDEVGQLVLGDIGGELGDEGGRNLGHVDRGRTLGELEGNQAVLADLEESSMHLGGVGILDGGGWAGSK